MFKKKPQIKSLSPLRSSDRRKLADQIISDFHVPISAAQQPANDYIGDDTVIESQPTLSSIRASLLPENCLSAKFTTSIGPDAKPVTGVVYVGAHDGQEERILWIQTGQRDQRLYPTVYTLWKNPGLVPLLHTPGIVVEKLQGGADLMTPGLARGPPFPSRATKNAIVAVASIEKSTVPVFVGLCEIDVSNLETVQGVRGHAVKGVHWAGDEVWAWSETGTGGRETPGELPDWDKQQTGSISDGVQGLTINDEDEEDAQEGGVALNGDAKNVKENAVLQTRPRLVNGLDPSDTAEIVEEQELTTKEIDDAFHKAFVFALYEAKQSGKPPQYGIEFPIQPSALISGLIQPHLPIFSATQAQQLTIKKTSWKNTRKFIKHLEKDRLCISKDRNGGETVVLDVDFNDSQIKDFVPYRLPKVEKSKQTGAPSGTTPSDPSTGQKLSIISVYRPSSKLVPDLLPSKSDYYTASDITTFLKTYIENSNLTANMSSARFVKLDPFLANNVLGSNAGAADTKALASGEIGRDVLTRRIIEDHNLCSPHWVLLRDGQKWSSGDSSLPKPKLGSKPQVTLTIEKRTGTKVVSKVGNIEVFGIHADLLASELQKKCASSTSVGQVVGGKPGMLEILVQGDQRGTIEKELIRRGIDKRWIEIIDKTKKKAPASNASGGRDR